MLGAIFDVDGTLLDSMSMWNDILIEFYREHGVEISEAEVLEYKDLTVKEMLPIIKERLELTQSFEELSNEVQRRGLYQYEHILPLKEGAGEYLKKLHDAGVKIALATSGFYELCEKAFSRLGVWQYIDACAFSSEVGANKSNPDVYLLAAERIGVAPEECTVYEDIVNGITGAKKGGFKTCAVYDNSNADDTEKLKTLSDRYITSWKELLQ